MVALPFRLPKLAVVSNLSFLTHVDPRRQLSYSRVPPNLNKINALAVDNPIRIGLPPPTTNTAEYSGGAEIFSIFLVMTVDWQGSAYHTMVRIERNCPVAFLVFASR